MKLIGNCKCCGKFVAIEANPGDHIEDLEPPICKVCIDSHMYLCDCGYEHCSLLEEPECGF